MSSKNRGNTSVQPPDITIEEYTFFTLVIQMGHGHHGSLKDCWSREEQLLHSILFNRDGM
jgi:protein-tyrosine-phosphatase